MNTYYAVAAAALAFVASINGEPCSPTQQASAYTSMVSLLQGTALSTCASDSGYNMLYATALPTAEQSAAMCEVDACHELIKNVMATNPPDCDLNIPTSGAVMNVKSLADNFEPGCTSSPATEAPAATTAPSAETPAPDATTAAPSAETTAPSAETTAPSAETTTPAVTPAATPTTPTAC